MTMTSELPDEAEILLKLHGYVWDNLLDGFRKVRTIGQESLEHYLKAAPDVISFEELKDHGLFEPIAPFSQRTDSLKWLEQRIKFGKPPHEPSRSS
jgi:hypothetical protein